MGTVCFFATDRAHVLCPAGRERPIRRARTAPENQALPKLPSHLAQNQLKQVQTLSGALSDSTILVSENPFRVEGEVKSTELLKSILKQHIQVHGVCFFES